MEMIISGSFMRTILVCMGLWTSFPTPRMSGRRKTGEIGRYGLSCGTLRGQFADNALPCVLSVDTVKFRNLLS